MKKLLTLALALMLVLSLAACGGEPATSPDGPAASETSTAAPASKETAPAAETSSKADLKNPEYTPEQSAVAEKFSAMSTRFQELADKINADASLLEVTELVDTMNTVIEAVNSDDALFADPANLTPEVLVALEKNVVAGNVFVTEIESMIANYSGKTILTLPVEIINMTGVELYGLALSPANDENWGGNLLEAPLADQASGVTHMTITQETLVWDLMAIDAEGTSLSFMGLDFSQAPQTGAKVMLSATEGGMFTANFTA